MRLEGIKALLFDLDGTLLGLDIQAFLPVYFQALTRRFDGIMPGPVLLDAIMKSTYVMVADTDLTRSNREAFWEDFLRRVSEPYEKLDALFSAFYQEDFPSLSYMAKALPEARQVLTRAREAGYTLVLATNPVFPRVAICERMRWAQIDDMPFRMVTAYEDMHACKPHVEYYQEIVDRLGLDPRECLMVGNDVQEDMVAGRLGMRTFLVDGPYLIDRGQPRYRPDGRGTLLDLCALL